MSVPKDIFRVASDIVLDIQKDGHDIDHKFYVAIAEALTAERERCAREAVSWAETALKLSRSDPDKERGLYHKVAADMARDVAAAIRQSKEPV